jgi:hypothetical protein
MGTSHKYMRTFLRKSRAHTSLNAYQGKKYFEQKLWRNMKSIFYVPYTFSQVSQL